MDFLKEHKHLLFCKELRGFDNPINNFENESVIKKWIWGKEKVIDNIREKYIENNDIKELERSLDVLRDRIEVFYKNFMGEEKFDKIKDSIKFMKNFTKERKTKKRREEFENQIKFIEELSKSIKLDLFKSIFLIYDINMTKALHIENKGIDIIYENYIENYEKTKEEISDKKRERDREIKGCKRRLEEYNNIEIKIRNEDIQEGKYYKKWILLTEEEKMERINSYVEFYCKEKELNQDEMVEYIKQNIEEKKINTKDIKWNTKKGVIVDMNIEYIGETFVIKVSKTKKDMMRCSDKSMNDIILKGVMTGDNIIQIEKEVMNENKIKKLNNKEKDVIKERYNQFKMLSDTI